MKNLFKRMCKDLAFERKKLIPKARNCCGMEKHVRNKTELIDV